VRAALVTGGSSGIGLAIARMLAEEGFSLTLVSRTAAKVEAAAAELGAEAVAADVADSDACERAVAAHAARFGRLDVLVNSAGIGIGATIDALPVRHVDLQLDVNLRGLMLVTAAALPLLREARGLVVNLASIAGTRPIGLLPVYSAAKAGVIAFTQALNSAEQEHGIRATALAPGFVDTAMAAWTGLPPERMISPEDCAELVRALLRLGPAARVPQIVVERLDSSGP
jgi:NAD(P)-dependent dehydrogenase (short-subunit alcohol dehydrogenase family)